MEADILNGGKTIQSAISWKFRLLGNGDLFCFVLFCFNLFSFQYFKTIIIPAEENAKFLFRIMLFSVCFVSRSGKLRERGGGGGGVYLRIPWAAAAMGLNGKSSI